MKTYQHMLIALSVTALAACSGGGDTTTETPAPTPTPLPSPAPTPTPTPEPTPTPTPCSAAPIAATGYSLVFKGCSASNVAEYYEKSECVRDNATGLIWQGQTPAGTGLRANNQDKTNFDSTSGLQKYDASVVGNYRAATSSEINAGSNSVGFKNAVNASNLCGFGDWRIPSQTELLGLVKLSETPKIDNVWFPNTPAVAWYWSSTPFSSSGTDWGAYGVIIATGAGSFGGRGGVASTGDNLVRLVR
jgi:Protein of unknown function (DUF1566)